MNLTITSFLKFTFLTIFCCFLANYPQTLLAQTWEIQTIPTTETQRSIHFIDADEGWSAGYNGTILHTTNSGGGWALQTSNTTERFLAIRFIDKDVGWVGAGRLILRTTDGGENWDDIGVDPAATKFRNSLFPVSSTVAWVPANSSGVPTTTRWFSRYTIEGGGSTTEEDFNVIESGALFYGIYFTDADNGWSVGSPGQIVRISNASSSTPSFSYQTSGTSTRLNGVFMLDSNNGWIVGHSGTILKTTDGGTTWTPLSSGTSTNLRNVHFINLSEGWIVGDNGLILATDDGGDNWSEQTSGVTTTLWSVFLINPGFAAGGDLSGGTNGVILKTYQPSSIYFEHNSDKIKGFHLYHNFPNPFNPTTTITFDIPQNAFVKLSVYNATGKKVSELLSGYRSTGSYTVKYDASNLASGIYYYSIVADDYRVVKKMMLIK